MDCVISVSFYKGAILQTLKNYFAAILASVHRTYPVYERG